MKLRVYKTDIVNAISQKITEEKKSMEKKHTAKLWLQYMDMVEILLIFIKAERTGNWNLHMKMNSKMLPYLAAAGHNNYTKSLYLYLQKMQQLKQHTSKGVPTFPAKASCDQEK